MVPSRAERTRRVASAVVAVGLHLPLGYMALALGLVVPAAVHAVLVLAWAGSLLLTARIAGRRPVLALAVAPAVAAVLVAVVAAGGAWFGWQA